jgi:hypothetical protein
MGGYPHGNIFHSSNHMLLGKRKFKDIPAQAMGAALAEGTNGPSLAFTTPTLAANVTLVFAYDLAACAAG